MVLGSRKTLRPFNKEEVLKSRIMTLVKGALTFDCQDQMPSNAPSRRLSSGSQPVGLDALGVGTTLAQGSHIRHPAYQMIIL